MSGLVMPCTWLQVSPPSRLRYTPSISTPASTVSESTGSTTSAVIRGKPMAHSWAMAADSFSQLLPPSLVRKRKGGLVPAKMVLGSEGLIAMAQIFSPSIGESSLAQFIPESSLRYMPLSAPAYTTLEFLGSTASARIWDSPGKGLPMRRQFSPESALWNSPAPVVPTRML